MGFYDSVDLDVDRSFNAKVVRVNIIKVDFHVSSEVGRGDGEGIK